MVGIVFYLCPKVNDYYSCYSIYLPAMLIKINANDCIFLCNGMTGVNSLFDQNYRD